jgi:hypothetical protein
MSRFLLRKDAVLKRKFIDFGQGRVPVALVAVAAGCLIAACGSSSSGSTSSSSATGTTASASSSGTSGSAAGSARRTQLVACLKSHGVTLPSRPAGSGPPPGGAGGSGGSGGSASGSGGGGTGTGTTGTGTGPRRGFFGGGGNISPKMRAAFQACGAKFFFGCGARGGFRGRLSHTAITKYVTCVRQHGYNLPNPNFSGKGPIFPANIQSNAKFQAASKACQSLLIPARPSGSGGTGTTSGA